MAMPDSIAACTLSVFRTRFRQLPNIEFLVMKHAVDRFWRVCLLLLLTWQAEAQGPPIFTETPIMLGLEGRGVRTFGKYVSADGGHTYVQLVAVPYNVATRFQVGGAVPMVWKTPADGGTRQSGLGDVSIFLKQQVFQKDGKGRTLRALLKATLGLPTGSTSSEPPIGSGVWQTGLAAVTGLITTRFGVYTELGYRWLSEGLPGRYFYNVALSVPLLPQQYPPRQINLSVDVNGQGSASNGNHALLLSPGLQWIAGRKLLLESGVQLPVVEAGLGAGAPNFAWLFGARVLIF